MRWWKGHVRCPDRCHSAFYSEFSRLAIWASHIPTQSQVSKRTKIKRSGHGCNQLGKHECASVRMLLYELGVIHIRIRASSMLLHKAPTKWISNEKLSSYLKWYGVVNTVSFHAFHGQYGDRPASSYPLPVENYPFFHPFGCQKFSHIATLRRPHQTSERAICDSKATKTHNLRYSFAATYYISALCAAAR